MEQSYFIGIDNGGSSIKCVIFNQYGSIISSSSTRVPLSKPFDGYTERDSEDVWTANCHVIQAALQKADLNPSDVKAVSVCGYGGGLILLDQNGHPVIPCIVSTDSRANTLLKTFQENGIDDQIYEYTFQRLWSGQHAMLLAWYQRECGDSLTDAAYALSIKDFIRYRLTGVIGTEVTDASNTNLFNIHTQKFDPEIFQILGIEDLFSLLPERIFSSFEIAGTISPKAAELTGLLPGTPVATGLYDVASCTLASGILDDSHLELIVGTWSISGYLTKDLASCQGRNNTLLSFLNDWYFSEESSPTSASNLDWFVESFYKKIFSDAENVYEACNLQVATLDPADNDLIFLPYLYGSNTSSFAKACFFNLSGYHTPAHMLMAIYEGILFSLVQHIRTLCGEQLPASARFSGGVSSSSIWCQMLADILGIPIETTDCKELGALGAAMCASIGCGLYKSPAEAVKNMYHAASVYTPDPQRTKLYAKKYAQYQKAVDCVNHFYSQEE